MQSSINNFPLHAGLAMFSFIPATLSSGVVLTWAWLLCTLCSIFCILTYETFLLLKIFIWSSLLEGTHLLLMQWWWYPIFLELDYKFLMVIWALHTHFVLRLNSVLCVSLVHAIQGLMILYLNVYSDHILYLQNYSW